MTNTEKNNITIQLQKEIIELNKNILRYMKMNMKENRNVMEGLEPFFSMMKATTEALEKLQEK
jgi:hypothetical protein